MKIRTRIFIAAVLAAGFTLVNPVNAQYQARGNDGIYASPKLRQILEQQRKVAVPTSGQGAQVSYQARGEDGIAASPGVRRILSEQKTRPGSASDDQKSVSYSAQGKDGIYASPGVRKVLNERGAQFQIAPLK